MLKRQNSKNDAPVTKTWRKEAVRKTQSIAIQLLMAPNTQTKGKTSIWPACPDSRRPEMVGAEGGVGQDVVFDLAKRIWVVGRPPLLGAYHD